MSTTIEISERKLKSLEMVVKEYVSIGNFDKAYEILVSMPTCEEETRILKIFYRHYMEKANFERVKEIASLMKKEIPQKDLMSMLKIMKKYSDNNITDMIKILKILTNEKAKVDYMEELAMSITRKIIYSNKNMNRSSSRFADICRIKTGLIEYLTSEPLFIDIFRKFLQMLYEDDKKELERVIEKIPIENELWIEFEKKLLEFFISESDIVKAIPLAHKYSRTFTDDEYTLLIDQFSVENVEEVFKICNYIKVHSKKVHLLEKALRYFLKQESSSDAIKIAEKIIELMENEKEETCV